jgi:hypothetical protein
MVSHNPKVAAATAVAAAELISHASIFAYVLIGSGQLQ